MAEKTTIETQTAERFYAAFTRWYRDSGKKQAEVAALLGMTQGALSKYLQKKKSLALATMEEFAKSLGRDFLDILAEGRAILGEEEAVLEEDGGESVLAESGPPILKSPAWGRPKADEQSPPPPRPQNGRLHLIRPPSKTILPFEPQLMDDEDLRLNGFFRVPFSDKMKLAAGGGGTIPITTDEETSTVIVHGPSIRRHNAKNLQAFRVGGDSMEPLISQGGIVMADVGEYHKRLEYLREGQVYILCWDLDEGECAVKYLRWVEKDRILAISSENDFYRDVYRRVEDVQLVGKVIWAWREFPD